MRIKVFFWQPSLREAASWRSRIRQGRSSWINRFKSNLRTFRQTSTFKNKQHSKGAAAVSLLHLVLEAAAKTVTTET